MTNVRSTKRAFLSSALALFLCFAMLLGTTFAWFTDSVKSANNIIMSGNLDIELEYWNGQEWADVKDKSDILTNNLWEPGTTEVAYFRVANAGTLALKYQLGINFEDVKAGTNVFGDKFLLSDYILFGVDEGITVDADNKPIEYANREAAVAAVEAVDATALGAVKKVSAGYTKPETMLSDTEVYFALVVYMPTIVENEANYKTAEDGEPADKYRPEINLGINIIATQLAYESDSFGSDYDEVAMVTNAEQLKAAVEAGGNVLLMDDINVNANTAITVAADKEVVIDMNGYSINGVSTEIGKNRAIFTVKGEMTFVGDGTVTYTHAGENMAWNNLTAAISAEGGIVTLNKGIVLINYGGSDMAFGVDVNTTGGETVLNVNGATIFSTYTAIREFNNHKTEKAIVNINSGLVAGDSRDIWVHNPSANAVDANGIVNIDASYAYDYDVTVQAATSNYGRIFNFDHNAILVVGISGLQKAIDNYDGTTIDFVADMNGDVNITKDGVTIDGNGYTLNGSVNLNGSDNVTLKNITFDAAGAQAAYDNSKLRSYANIFGASKGGNIGARNITIDGCTFEGKFENAGVAIAFADRSRPTGFSGDITIKNCTFNTENANYDVYGYYTGQSGMTFTIENNTFASECRGCSIYLGRLRTNEAIVVTGNTFETMAALENAVYIQGDGSYAPTLNAADNTFNG